MSPDDDRLATLERQVAALTEEVARLRAVVPQAARPAVRPGAGGSAPPQRHAFERASAAAQGFGEEQLESFVGRYGTLLLGGLVLLMGVGVLIQLAVARGLLTPAVRVGIGALVAAMVGAAGIYFHRRGDVRYANVLLALALALVDLVAWGAGPRLHLVSTSAALAVVDVVAVAVAALALHDESEFLFSVAVAAALSAPFVASADVGSADGLLAYGGVVSLGALRAGQQPDWSRAFAVLVGGALVYALAAAGMPVARGWQSPFAVSLFAAVCAAGALLFAHGDWRGRLARGYLAVALIGVSVAWDRVAAASAPLTWSIALVLAAITFSALAVRAGADWWTASALVLPLASLGLALPWASSRRGVAGAMAVWGAFSVIAWSMERRRGEPVRGGAHLTSASLLGTLAIGWALWPSPFWFVVGLAGWGAAVAWACSGEVRLLPLAGVAVPLGAAAMSAMDQLASRPSFGYVPLATRSSASAFAVTLGLLGAGLALARGSGLPGRVADRAVRIGVLIGFVILWGRMEVAGAWTPDLAAFLLIAYYAACGLGSILAGRRYGVGRLRMAGLGLAIYAAVKAIVEASDIGELLLRVGAYGAVGVFLLAAGYLYREAGVRRRSLES